MQSVRSVSDNIRVVLADSSLCQNGKQVEIITKMIFELCYIEAILFSRVRIFLLFFYPAGRVAPIRGSVLCLRFVVALGA